MCLCPGRVALGLGAGRERVSVVVRMAPSGRSESGRCRGRRCFLQRNNGHPAYLTQPGLKIAITKQYVLCFGFKLPVGLQLGFEVSCCYGEDQLCSAVGAESSTPPSTVQHRISSRQLSLPEEVQLSLACCCLILSVFLIDFYPPFPSCPS